MRDDFSPDTLALLVEEIGDIIKDSGSDYLELLSLDPHEVSRRLKKALKDAA